MNTQAQPNAAANNAANAAAKCRKVRRNVTLAVVHVKATFNNTVVTVTDTKGDVLCWCRQAPPASKAAAKARPSPDSVPRSRRLKKAAKYGVKEVEVKVKGPGSGRESAITALQMAGLAVKSIEDVTPLPQRLPPAEEASRSSSFSPHRFVNAQSRLQNLARKQILWPVRPVRFVVCVAAKA